MDRKLAAIVRVMALSGHKLELVFEDGVTGVVDVAQLIPLTGVFSPLQDEAYFAQVQLHPEFHTVFWPNGADLDPDVLYSVVSGTQVTGPGCVH